CWMVASDVIGAAIFNPILPESVTRAGGLELEHLEIPKRIGLPAQHVCFDLVQRIPTGRLKKAADGLPSRAAINLGGAANVERRVAGRILQRNAVDSAINSSTANSQLR